LASIVVAGDTSGTVTLAAPAVSGTTTLTLPTTSGTVLTSASTITPSAGTVNQAALATGVAGTGPAFSAYLSTNQSISSATFTKVQCNTEEFDTNNNYDNATNYRFTPTVAGYYQISGCINFSSSTKVEFLTSIFKNGSEFKRGVYVNISTANSENCSVSALVYLNGTTDYVELYGYLNGTGSPLFTGNQYNVYFQGVMVRSA
jgi:hypothetical protein